MDDTPKKPKGYENERAITAQRAQTQQRTRYTEYFPNRKISEHDLYVVLRAIYDEARQKGLEVDTIANCFVSRGYGYIVEKSDCPATVRNFCDVTYLTTKFFFEDRWPDYPDNWCIPPDEIEERFGRDGEK